MHAVIFRLTESETSGEERVKPKVRKDCHVLHGFRIAWRLSGSGSKKSVREPATDPKYKHSQAIYHTPCQITDSGKENTTDRASGALTIV